MTEITTNKKLLFDYEILEKIEAGIMLSGSEVKAVKKGQMDIKGSFVSLKINPQSKSLEAFLVGSRIAKYGKAGYAQDNYNPARTRKLLLKSSELSYLTGKTAQKGLTILPLSVYTTPHRLIKIIIVLAKGRKKIDKRDVIKKREFERRKRKILS